LHTPERSPHDREGGRAVADDRSARGILDRGLAPPHILSELRALQPSDHLVTVAVARDFVAPGLDRPHESAVPLGDPAEHEERGGGAGLVQHVQEPLGSADHAALEARPLLRPDHPRESLRMEILLYVEGQGVDHSSWPTGASAEDSTSSPSAIRRTTRASPAT